VRPEAPNSLTLELERAGVAVTVEVEVGINDDPAALGCPEFARGFPTCHSTISPPARGYGDMLGWVQLVRQPDWGEGFRIDPFEPIDTEPTHPFCFFGFAPTQFDAPHRDTRPDMDWTAHTFLAGVAGIHEPRGVCAAAGFSWGFRIRDSRIEVEGAHVLEPGDWDRHLPYLRGTYPGWSFAPGFALPDPPRR
jgi:hypothetical protein